MAYASNIQKEIAIALLEDLQKAAAKAIEAIDSAVQEEDLHLLNQISVSGEQHILAALEKF